MANTTGLPVLFSAGIHASRPSASAVGSGGLYACSTHSKIYQSDGVSTWTDWQTSPAAATRASLGLDTTDSPQFAGVNIGAATDTTVTRTGAGDIAVEGNALYRAGGTDVPIADGGTGASTKAAGFDALSPMTTQDDIVIGGASGTGTRLAKGTDGQVLTVDPTTHHLLWATPASGFSDPMTTRGDIIIRNSSNATARLGRGTATYVLTSDGTDVAWAAPGGGGALTVEEVDGSPTDSAVTKIVFPNGTLAIASHVATYTAAAGAPTGTRYPVQTKAAVAGSQGSVGVTLSATPTNGNLLIAVIESEGGTNVTGISQTNVTWTKVAESTASTAPHSEIWKGVVSASASTSMTVTWSGTTYCGFHVSEWSGVTGTLDQSATVTAQVGGLVPIITPTSQTALVISAGAESTFGAGFSAVDGPVLMTLPNNFAPNFYAAAFAFPGKSGVVGTWPNANGGTFSGVTVSLT